MSLEEEDGEPENYIYQKFELDLDRSTKDKKEMIRRYQSLYQQLEEFEDFDQYPLVPDYV